MATAKKTTVKKTTTTKKATPTKAVVEKERNFDTDFVPGENCVLYHVRKPLPKMTLTMENTKSHDEFIDEIRESYSHRFPAMTAPKWSAIAKILHNEVTMKTREDQIDHTLAIGYNPKHNALVVAYSKPNRNHDTASRKIGYASALKRLERGMKHANADKVVHINESLISAHIGVLNNLPPYLKKAKAFFSDKKPTTFMMYTADIYGEPILVANFEPNQESN